MEYKVNYKKAVMVSVAGDGVEETKLMVSVTYTDEELGIDTKSLLEFNPSVSDEDITKTILNRGLEIKENHVERNIPTSGTI